MRKKKNYVNNKDLFEVMKKYHEDYHEAKRTGGPAPKIPNYVGECLMLIAKRLATKPNFVGYSFREDMEMDGVENALLYLHNFDPNKTNNPFAYFTQIITFAFIRRIQKEKKQQYIKIKNFQRMCVDTQNEDWTGGASSKATDAMDHFVASYENTLTKKKKAAKLKASSTTSPVEENKEE